MPRTPDYTVTELKSRAKRNSLPSQPRPYFCHLRDGLSMGYRRGKLAGSWTARMYDDTGKPREHRLGKANDADEGIGMSFQQAADAALAWFKQANESPKSKESKKPAAAYTVADLMADYVADRELRKRKDQSKLRSAIGAHILPTMRSVPVASLTQTGLEEWRDGLAKAAPRVRSKEAGIIARRAIDPDDEDAQRKRQATANRIFTILRAALNFGYRRERIASNQAWDRIKPFEQTDAAKVRYLSIEECMRLIAACPPDFRKMVRAALYTGCRYGELCAMKPNAFNPDSNTVHIPKSKSGKARHINLSDEGAAFFASVVDEQKAAKWMFTHAAESTKKYPGVNEKGERERLGLAGTEWRETQQAWYMDRACKEAKIEPAVGFHILRHTMASLLAMKNTSMPVIAAQLGHADTRMTEKHYAHLAQSYIATTVRANLPSFGFETGPKLVRSAS